MKLSKHIPDLHYRVVRIPGHFTRGGYACVFYRHDKDGKPFIDDVWSVYGNDLRSVRKQAYAYGRNIVTRQIGRSLRNTYICVHMRDAVRKAFPEIPIL